jgi:lipopolysaccharide export system protein LptA
MIRLAAILLALVLTAGAARAESPVKVTADTFTVDQARSEATFVGNVVVTRDDLTVWASRVLVTFGEGGLENIKQIVATGSVRLKTSDQDATGDRAVFDPNSQVLRLTGNVTVVSAAGTLSGPELVVNLAEQTTTFSSSGGGRVTGVFTPQ